MKIISIKSFISKSLKFSLCFILSAVQRLLWLSGLFEIYLRLSGKNGATIIMYHSIVDSNNHRFIDPTYTMGIDEFEQQMKFLSKHRHVISMGELVKKLTDGETPKRGTVVITFDDGYLDNYELAAPVLEKHCLPATIYLATAYISRSEPQWIDQLYCIFQSRTRHTLSLEEKGIRKVFDLRKNREMHKAHSALICQLIESDKKTRTILFLHIQNELKPSGKVPQITLSWNDIKEMMGKYSNIEFGAHTHDHISLTSMDKKSIVEEIATCKRDIESHLGYAPKHFTYPYGRSNPEVRSIVESMDFKSAAVTDPVSLIDKNTNLFCLPRLNAPKSMTMFRALTGGATVPLISQKWSWHI